jgi:murein DD-endopeptidase MepM/ murein hydrolase activator NlpD
VSVLLRLTAAENVLLDGPIVAVAPANSRERIGRIAVADRGRGWRYAYSWSWRLGSVDAQPDSSALYRLPWMDGRTFRIGQAPGGRITTHTTRESRYAIDVSMPEGTPIVAARAGVVIRVAAGFSEGGVDEALRYQANAVSVLHPDATIADYVHLMKGGVAVRVGEAVVPGKLIGYAGSTGYSSGPHLHFALTRLVREGDSFEYESVPIAFYVGSPPRVFAPASGMTLRATGY